MCANVQCNYNIFNIHDIHDRLMKINFSFQVLSALDILQPPHLDFFQEMYPFSTTSESVAHCDPLLLLFAVMNKSFPYIKN